MMWEPRLKERVQERVGARGLTDFVIEAVQEKLDSLPPMTVEEMRQMVEQRNAVVEADQPPRVFEPDQSVVPQPSGARSNGRAVEEPVAPAPPVTQRFASSAGGLADMLGRAAAMGVQTDDLSPVQAEPITDVAVADPPDACPTCGQDRIDGECWTCD